MCVNTTSFWDTPLMTLTGKAEAQEMKLTGASGSAAGTGHGIAEWVTPGHLIVLLAGVFLGLFLYKRI